MVCEKEKFFMLCFKVNEIAMNNLLVNSEFFHVYGIVLAFMVIDYLFLYFTIKLEILHSYLLDGLQGDLQSYW